MRKRAPSSVRRIKRGDKIEPFIAPNGEDEWVDLFAGAGGTAKGLIDSYGTRDKDVILFAMNHDVKAISTHQATNPEQRHLCIDLEDIDPRDVLPACGLRGLIASPVCTHFTNAGGGMPLNRQMRSTIKYVLRWTTVGRPLDILIENVPEFQTFGPLHRAHSSTCKYPDHNLIPKGVKNKCHFQRPIKERKGQFFRGVIGLLEKDYNVEYRVLNCANYGDATTRKRLFIRCRRKDYMGGKIIWPHETHSKPAGCQMDMFIQYPKRPWRTAREILDLTKKGRSIFTPAFGPKGDRYLVKATMKRVIKGLKFSGLPMNGEPYIVQLNGTSTGQEVDLPIPSIAAGGNHFAMATPFVLGQQSGATPRPIGEPLPTIAGAGAISLSEPYIIAIRGGDDGYTRGCASSEPMPGITTSPALAVAEPVVRIVPVNHGGKDARSSDVKNPFPSITSVDAWGLAEYISLFHGGKGSESRSVPLNVPLPSQDTSNRMGVCKPYIVQFNGTSTGADIDLPLPSVTGNDRFAVCVPLVDGYALVDILFRMVEWPELARAHSYDDFKFQGTRKATVKQIGNGVPRLTATALALSMQYQPGEEDALWAVQQKALNEFFAKTQKSVTA